MRIPVIFHHVGDFQADLRKIQFTLAQIEEGLDPKLEKALLEAAHFMVGQAQSRVRVDTGSLMKSIRVEHIRQLAVRVRAGGYITNPKTGKIVNYAIFVEAKYPFLRPSWEEAKHFVKEKIRESMEDLVHV